jgi:hypothetical protein
MLEIIRGLDIKLEAEHVLKGQGIEPSRASSRLLEAAAEILEEVKPLIEPAAIICNLPVHDFQHQSIYFEGGHFEGPLVSRSLAGASEISLALCTIGPKLEERMEELMAADMVKGLALDGAGTAAIGLVSHAVRNKIVSAAESRGLKMGMKAQPGQEGWPIEQQRVLFSILPAKKINVRLTDSCLMIPRKSVTFVIPFGNDLCEDAVPCDFCSKRDRCQWRKEKSS